jgi:cytochrome c553
VKDGEGIIILPGTDIGGRVYEGMPCIVCHEKVEEGTGAQAMPPLPAMHGKCIPIALEKMGKGKR